MMHGDLDIFILYLDLELVCVHTYRYRRCIDTENLDLCFYVTSNLRYL